MHIIEKIIKKEKNQFNSIKPILIKHNMVDMKCDIYGISCHDII